MKNSRLHQFTQHIQTVFEYFMLGKLSYVRMLERFYELEAIYQARVMLLPVGDGFDIYCPGINLDAIQANEPAVSLN